MRFDKAIKDIDLQNTAKRILDSNSRFEEVNIFIKPEYLAYLKHTTLTLLIQITMKNGKVSETFCPVYQEFTAKTAKQRLNSVASWVIAIAEEELADSILVTLEDLGDEYD